MGSVNDSIKSEDKPLFASLHGDSVLHDYENSDDPVLTLKVREVYYDYIKKILENNAREAEMQISDDTIVGLAREIELLALRMCMSSNIYREIMRSKIDHIKYLTYIKLSVFDSSKDNSVVSEQLGISEPDTIKEKMRERRINMYFDRYSSSVMDNKYTPNGSKNRICTWSSDNSEQEVCGSNSEADFKRRRQNNGQDTAEDKEPDKTDINSEIQQTYTDIFPEFNFIADLPDNGLIDGLVENENQDIFESIPENQISVQVEAESVQQENIQDQVQTPEKGEDNSDVFNNVYKQMYKIFEDPPENNKAMSESSSTPVMNTIEKLLGPGDFIDYSAKRTSHICKKRIAWHVRNSLSAYYKGKCFRSVDEFRILAKNIVSKLQGIDPYIDYKLIYRAISRSFHRKRVFVETISQIHTIVMEVADYVTKFKTS